MVIAHANHLEEVGGVVLWGEHVTSLGFTARPARLKQKQKNTFKRSAGGPRGLVIAPAYDLEIKVKWGNILAFGRAVRRGLDMERLPESAVSAIAAVAA
jgi:hypothetical protein